MRKKKVPKDERDLLAKEYGIYHFRVPTEREQISAMGLYGESMYVKKIISHEYTRFYQTIPAPNKNDWLMNYKEFGQTYTEFKQKGQYPIEPNKEVIYIAPGTFNVNQAFDESFLTGMLLLCTAYFHGMEIRFLDGSINGEGIEYREYEDGKYQGNANMGLEKLYNQMPDDGYCLISITDVDLFNDTRIIKPRDYIYDEPLYCYDFCYEGNSFKYRIGLISLARYDALFVLDDPPEDKEFRIKMYFILLKRAAKTIIKNITHMFGLKNCIFFRCIMNGFNTIEEFDKRPFELCPICLRKLYSIISWKPSNQEYQRQKEEKERKDGMEDTIKLAGRMAKDDGDRMFERFITIKQCGEENFLDLFEVQIKWYEERIQSLLKVG